MLPFCKASPADPVAQPYPETLLRLGRGRLPSLDDDYKVSTFSSLRVSASLHSTCLQYFEGHHYRCCDETCLTSRVVLTTKNSTLSVNNDYIVDLIPKPYRAFLSADLVPDELRAASRYPVELFIALTAGFALPSHHLKAQKGFHSYASAQP